MRTKNQTMEKIETNKELVKYSRNNCERKWCCFDGQSYVENPCIKCKKRLNMIKETKTQ